MMLQPVAKAFFRQPTLELARALLGMLLVHETEEGLVSGRIVETEAYIGPGDRAAHSYNNRRTPRTEIMFGEAGYAYTYSMHTHCLLNVVSGQLNAPEAVLIRAIEPLQGIHWMSKRRGPVKYQQDLTNGPGKLTKALGITMAHYGVPLFERPLYIAEKRDEKSVSASITVDSASQAESPSIAAGPRIGIDNSGEARDYPWRFWLEGNRFVTKSKLNKVIVERFDTE